MFQELTHFVVLKIDNMNMNMKRKKRYENVNCENETIQS